MGLAHHNYRCYFREIWLDETAKHKNSRGLHAMGLLNMQIPFMGGLVKRKEKAKSVVLNQG